MKRLTAPAGLPPGQLLPRIRTAMEELVDEAQRTYPQQPAGPDDLWWQPAHLGGTAPTPMSSLPPAWRRG